MAWQLAEAKNKLSEVFTNAMDEGPQFITRRNQEAVLISKDEYLKLLGERPNFVQHLLSIPKVENIDLDRDKMPLRDYER